MKIFAYLGFFFLSSCTARFKKPKDNEQVQSQVEVLSKQYNASAVIDTSNFHFTYQFQDVLLRDSLFILSELELSDIKRTDSVLILSVFRPSNQGGVLFDLKCSPEQIKKVFAQLPVYYADGEDSLKGISLIVEIEKVKKFRLKVSSDIHYQEDEDDDETFSYLLIKNPDIFHCTGFLVDVVKNVAP